MFTALILTSILALTPAPAQDAPSQSCREAYVEGWFQETAEADLEAALRSYRTCTAIGTSTDSELVARAWWRMGMIARAREENEVAEQLFEKVLAEFQGTRAVARVKEALAEPAGMNDAESEAVTNARAVLRTVLLDPGAGGLAQLRVILRGLTAEQIADECRKHDGSLAIPLDRVGGALGVEYAGKLAELVPVADLQTARYALESLRKLNLHSLPIPYLALSQQIPGDLDKYLLFLLGSQHGDEAMEALERVVERNPALIEWRNEGWVILKELVTNPHPVAGEVVGRMLSNVPREMGALELLAQTISNTRWTVYRLWHLPLHESTPGGEALRAFFPTLPSSPRDMLAKQFVGHRGDTPRAVVDLLLSDPEPTIRRKGLLLLVYGADLAWRAEALVRVRGERAEEQLAVLEAACTAADPAYALDDLLDVAPGPSREYVYVATLSHGPEFTAEGRGIVDILRTGLDRGDPELLTAVFAPTDELLQLGRASINLGQIAEALRQEAPAVQEESLAKRLILAALASPVESVRAVAPALAKEALSPDELTACIELALADPSPRVRFNALLIRPKGVSTELLVAALVDPDGSIFTEALYSTEPGPEALLAALDSLSVDRRLQVLGVARSNDYVEVVRALYESDPAKSSSAIERGAFEFLKTHDARILIAALTHPDYLLRDHARVLLYQLHLPGMPPAKSLERQDERERVQKMLQENEAEVARALQLWIIDRLTNDLSIMGAEAELAGVLADLGDRQLLMEYALFNSQARNKVGARGLVLLGDRETMREALILSHDPQNLVPFALQLDLFDTCLELYRSGRLGLRKLIGALETAQRYEELARLLFGEPRPLLARVIRPRPLALAVEAAAALRDEGMLSRAAERHHSGAAVNALFELGALDRILTDLPRWQGEAQSAALLELARRLGEPAEWSEYEAEQAERIAEWREQL